MSLQLSVAEAKKRTKLLNQLVAEHGLVKIAFGAIMSVESMRMANSATASRVIGEQSLALLQYRLADEAVWSSKIWTKAQKAADVNRTAKTKQEAGRRAKIGKACIAKAKAEAPITPPTAKMKAAAKAIAAKTKAAEKATKTKAAEKATKAAKASAAKTKAAKAKIKAKAKAAAKVRPTGVVQPPSLTIQ